MAPTGGLQFSSCETRFSASTAMADRTVFTVMAPFPHRGRRPTHAGRTGASAHDFGQTQSGQPADRGRWLLPVLA